MGVAAISGVTPETFQLPKRRTRVLQKKIGRTEEAFSLLLVLNSRNTPYEISGETLETITDFFFDITVRIITKSCHIIHSACLNVDSAFRYRVSFEK